jgi:uncharacterized repeat protein (TIGR03803 family)
MGRNLEEKLHDCKRPTRSAHGREGDTMSKFGATTLACIALCAVCVVSVQAQSFASLFSFDEMDGDNPYSALVQGPDGSFYGTTSSQFGSGYGTVFEIKADGALTTLYSFCSLPNCADGSYPFAGLTLATDGNFYGLTTSGGTNNQGTLFRVTARGVLTTLYSFCSQAHCADGFDPGNGLLQGADGNFYGVTVYGGTNGYGTIFEMTPEGVLRTLYNFCSQSNCSDGSNPIGGLVQGKNGALYGTTAFGGAYGNYQYGTVYKLTSKGKLSTIYSFCSLANCADGRYPVSGLVLASNGNFYGTTSWGGLLLALCNNGATGCGTVFEISADENEKLTTLYDFCSKASCADGQLASSALIQGRSGKLFGTTQLGGIHSYGTVFQLSLAGELTTLHDFDSTDGSEPLAALLQAADGSLYGTTLEGGSGGWGTVFHIAQ